MRFARFSLAAATFVLALGSGGPAGPAPARAENPLIDRFAMRTVTRILIQYALLAARTMVDLTYQHLAVDPHSGDVVITGLKLYPALDWDRDGTCVVEIDRIAGSADIGFEVIELRREITGVSAAPSCFEPEQSAMMAAVGYDGLTVENMSFDLSYEFASSAAAGDRSSAGLRERLDRRFAGAEGAAREAWKAVSQGAAADAIETWSSGGLGARVAALYRVAQ